MVRGRRRAPNWQAPELARSAAVALLGILTSGLASAGGFETPILYTARHQAMGGTAIGYVDDPSAALHNPAGLQGVQGLALIGNVSVLMGELQATPSNLSTATDARSEATAPLLLAGVAYALQPWLTLGAALFPLAAGSGQYRYSIPGSNASEINTTRLVAVEATPALSLTLPTKNVLPGRLGVGLGYRMTFLSFDRRLGAEEDPEVVDAELTGSDLGGFRVGMQYQPLPEVGLGAVYRSPVRIRATAPSATLLGETVTNVNMPFLIPAQLGMGVRVDWERLGAAVDLSYSFNSENEQASFSGTLGNETASLDNIMQWSDAITTRVGLEYRLGERSSLPLRIGYALDGRVTNPAFPSAFGTPPVSTHSISGGAGYHSSVGDFNVAIARRFGTVDISQADLAPAGECTLCSYSGHYRIHMTGLYLDYSKEFDQL